MALYGLTPKQFKLVEVLINPDFRDKTVKEECEAVGISTRGYYHNMHNEAFQEALEKAREDILRAAVLPIIRRAIEAALGDSFQDRKLLLEMAGAYSPKSPLEGEISIKITGPEDLKKEEMV